jgi:dihydropteroate synthase
VIWARPLSWGGAFADLALLARSGLSAAEQSLVAGGLDRVALLTGLAPDSRELAADVVGSGWLGGAGEAALVRYSQASLGRWCAGLDEGSTLRRALVRLQRLERPLAPTAIGPRTFAWGERTFLMGVLNVTPDSFSDGGQRTSPEAALAHAEALAADGADLLDIGGESTRPGATPVSLEEELRRVVPVVALVRRRLPGLPLSVDTSKPEVARAALDAGADLVNDVTALASPGMLALLAERRAPAVAMHMQGTPGSMQTAPAYDDVVEAVLDRLEDALARAEAAGLARSQLLVDPGIGFGKALEHNLFLLRHLGMLRLLGAPVLLGTSRKAFLGALTSGRPPAERDRATAASVAVAASMGGVDVVRVHDVAGAREALQVADAVARARGGGRHFGA